MSSYLLGIDIGTTATKGVLLHPEKGIVAEAEAPTTLTSPYPGWAEEDPTQWWENTIRVCRECIHHAKIKPNEIRGIGISGMVPTLILLDENGEVLYPSIQQNDARAFQEIEEIRSKVDEQDILTRTGSPITQQSIGPKLIWMRRHHPELFEKAKFIMGSYDYIGYKLTNSHSNERNWALESGLYDLNKQNWAEDVLELCWVNTENFGNINWPSEIIGKVSTQAAIQTGLAPGTPVVAGCADHIASAFSAGLKSNGDLLVKLGGAGDILFSLDELIIDKRLFLDYHAIPGKYFLNGCMAASGSIIKWFKNHFAPTFSYSELDLEAASIPVGANNLIVLPYFLGEKTPLNDPLARGLFFGLTLSHSRGHLYRAILEGISFGFLHHLEVFRELGLKTTKARVTNGGARSLLWKQISADVIGIPLEQISNHPGSSLGSAFIAGMGVGVFSEWSEIENFIKISNIVEPNKDSHQRYQQLFKIYLQLYKNVKDQYLALHQIV